MPTPRIFETLVEHARRGTVRPVIAETLDLEHLAQARDRLAERRHVGKLVVVP